MFRLRDPPARRSLRTTRWAFLLRDLPVTVCRRPGRSAAMGSKTVVLRDMVAHFDEVGITRQRAVKA
jgi:hypothetical protein